MKPQIQTGKANFPNLVFVILLILGIAGSNLLAQPSGYCVPYPKGSTYEYCFMLYYQQYGYQYGNVITDVQVVRVSDNSIVYDRPSGNDNCFIFTNEVINVKYGNTYKINMTFVLNYCFPTCYNYSGWGTYNRLWIDWNQNGTFNDATEWIGNSTLYQAVTTNTPYTVSWTVTIPCTVASGQTRMRLSTCYAYDNGSDACTNGWYYDYGSYQYNEVYGEMEDYLLNFVPDVEATFPADKGILKAGEVYDGTTRSGLTFTKPMARMGATQAAGAILHYQVTGPRPATTVVYEGLDPVSMSPSINMGGYRQYDMQAARGAYAYGTNGAFMTSVGGEYKLAVTISGGGCPGAAYETFTVSWPDDLAAADYVSPLSNGSPRYQKYLRNNIIPCSGLFQNVGLNPVTEFWAYMYIVNPVTGDTVYKGSRHYDAVNNPGDAILYATQKVQIDFGTTRILSVGQLNVYLHCDLVSAVDNEPFNNDLPRSGDPAYVMEVAYEIQLQASRMVKPQQGDIVIGNRPVIPWGEFKNAGVYDASDVPAKLNVYQLPSMTLAYTNSIIVQDIPSGKYNTKQAQFAVMNLRETGDYEAELIIAHPDDPVRSDDTVRITFSVQGGLVGTYTVGVGGNFPTIDSAMNVLYYRGLAGSVTFLLTDSYYKISGRRTQDPAWDFSNYIINLGYDDVAQKTNTITWKPSSQMAVSKGSVTIDMYSPSGKGVTFGQSMDPANQNSIYYQYQSYGSIARKYVNSPGYITFDGGSQKSLKFKINSYSKGAQAFYLSRGTSNITINNCLIENATPATATSILMPMTVYSPVSGFTFQNDTLVNGSVVTGYSAGVVNRSSLFGTEQAGLLHVDTLQNKNNAITGNEIYGFGYGVVSLGIGELLLENKGDFARFYNMNNQISNNLIYNATRAGIYLGYEENTSVTGNRIYGVTNSTGYATGIMAGGDGTTQVKGYNNILLNIQGNEISAVSSGIYAGGIKIEQARNTFPHPSKGQVFFPDTPELLKISNNVVWGITGTTAAANRVGIHLLTERGTGSNAWITLATPSAPVYHPTGDQLVNNTIVLGSNNGIATTGAIAGIALQNLTGTILKNNAIALTDIGVDATSPAYTGIFYEGTMPLSGGLTSDRNVFWAPTNANASFFRFLETDASSTILDWSTRTDYSALDQWRNWTKQDLNSAFGNFLNDLVYLGADPNLRLRVQTNPAPLGSLLNNRGDRISWLTTDIDGNLRGTAAQRYDIGASEFDGRLYLTDVEALTITSPAAYKAGSGFFSDAEYIMTTSPVNVKGMVRNSGNLQQNNVQLTVNIYRETPTGIFSNVPEVTATTNINIAPGESYEASFNLADKLAPDFAPMTYGDLRGSGYVVPTQFSSMEANVTPKYRIVVNIGADQNNANNSMQKDVRFYIRKSDMRIVLSGENSMTTLDANSTKEQIAGRLNADSLKAALARVGWAIDISKKRYDFDMFDRLGWEPKAVDYSMYRTMWYADGDDMGYTRYEIMAVENFLNLGSQMEKKNFIISSQEAVRSNTDTYFTGNILRAVNAAPGNPLGLNASNDGKLIMGIALFRGLTEQIKATGFKIGVTFPDADPYCGLLKVSSTGDGLAQPAGYYMSHGILTDSVSGVTTSTLSRNVVFNAVDWRHWKRADYLIRASVDFIEKNGGTIVPVELLSFNANQVNTTVQMNWQTATEYQSSKFEIERAAKTETGTSIFAKIGEEKAAGTSSVTKSYGPVIDYNVTIGNTYVYRLKMIDLNGDFKYSNEQEVKVSGDNMLWLSESVPSPVTNEANMDYSVDAAGTVNFDLIDMSGKLVKNLFNGSVNAGTSKLTFGTSDIPNGSYSVVMRINDRTTVQRITIMK